MRGGEGRGAGVDILASSRATKRLTVCTGLSVAHSGSFLITLSCSPIPLPCTQSIVGRREPWLRGSLCAPPLRDATDQRPGPFCKRHRPAGLLCNAPLRGYDPRARKGPLWKGVGIGRSMWGERGEGGGRGRTGGALMLSAPRTNGIRPSETLRLRQWDRASGMRPHPTAVLRSIHPCSLSACRPTSSSNSPNCSRTTSATSRAYDRGVVDGWGGEGERPAAFFDRMFDFFTSWLGFFESLAVPSRLERVTRSRTSCGVFVIEALASTKHTSARRAYRE